jgi:hypothetical protein
MAIMTQICIALFLGASLYFFYLAIKSYLYQKKNRRGKSINEQLYVSTLWLISSIVSYHLAIAFEIEGLGAIDGFIKSFVLTLQVFSLDAEYIELVVYCKELFANQFNWHYALPGNVLAVYISILNLLAPLATGAIILGLLTSVIPNIRLQYSHRRIKYVFSELNDRAICLAESIYEVENKRGNKIDIVFTDTYINKDIEAEAEIKEKARLLNAICVSDDILDLKFFNEDELFYILMDEDEKKNLDEGNNLHTLTMLATEDKERWRKDAKVRIYVISQNKEISTIIKELYKQDRNKEKYKLSPEDNPKNPNVLMIAVHEFTGIVYDLLDKVPLYTPLIAKDPNIHGKKDLHITIIGGGKIGTEVFLSAYWCGQMLDTCLHINIITDDHGKFIATINHLNPEIISSQNEKEPFLKVYPGRDDYNEPYAKFKFIRADVTTDVLFKVLDTKDAQTGFSLMDSDYFVVALGTDYLNMSIATDLNRMIQRKMLFYKANDTTYKERLQIIAYSIFDTGINKVLKDLGHPDSKTRLYPFAAMKNIYSYDNIIENRFLHLAFNIGSIHESSETKKSFKDIFVNKFLTDEYSYWSSIARVLHRKYKVYCCGIYDDDISKYWDIVNSEEQNDLVLQEKLSWLEHRRWNSFLRSKGFICPSDEVFDLYAFSKKPGFSNPDHKHLVHKLHVFIVESAINQTTGKHAKISPDDWDKIATDDCIKKLCAENPDFDRLDIASFKVYLKKIENVPDFDRHDKWSKTDYKVYDHPSYDAGNPNLPK